VEVRPAWAAELIGITDESGPENVTRQPDAGLSRGPAPACLSERQLEEELLLLREPELFAREPELLLRVLELFARDPELFARELDFRELELRERDEVLRERLDLLAELRRRPVVGR
jgi:hypothetical protein